MNSNNPAMTMGDTTPARPHFKIEDVHRGLGSLADFLQSEYGILTGVTSGVDTPVECPVHHPGHTTSANVHDYGNKQVFTCFRCDVTEDVIGLVKMLDHVDTAGATQKLGEWLRLSPGEYGHEKPKQRRTYKPRETSRKDLRARMESERITDPISMKDSLERYCYFRDWHMETAETLDIHLAKRTFRDGEVAGVMRHPFVAKGLVVGWQDRTKRVGAKWMSGFKQKLPAYNLDAVSMVDENEIVITEGISDCISLLDSFGCTYPAIGIPGAATVSRELIAGLSGWRVVYVPDNDAAGSGMAERLESFREHIDPVRVNVPSEYSDLTDWKQAIGDRVEFAERFELAIISALSKRAAA